LYGSIAITDSGWYETLKDLNLEEVNFWTPSPRRAFRGEQYSPFLFKLHAPASAICGFGYFAQYSRLPDWLAWDAFGIGNGCRTFDEMQQRIFSIRVRLGYKDPSSIPEIGCILIVQPTFFSQSDWISAPSDWPPQTQTSKRYDLTKGEGERVWLECLERAGRQEKLEAAEASARYGEPVLIKPRLGQGTFRVVVTEAYERACAVTGEHSLPVLEAAHIKPFAESGPNEVRNGLLLRADLHRLFDKGYITITPDFHLEVSPRLRYDFQNGRTYYPLQGTRLRVPRRDTEKPDPVLLKWHNETKYLKRAV
jgi:putative restriction endonuclease